MAPLTATDQLVGTVDYLAPERIAGEQADGRADLYALGCVLFECLTGEVPFPRDSEAAAIYAHLEDEPPRASERRPGLPLALDAVIARALEKEPGAAGSPAPSSSPRRGPHCPAERGRRPARPRAARRGARWRRRAHRRARAPRRPAPRALGEGADLALADTDAVAVIDPGGLAAGRHRRGLVPV